MQFDWLEENFQNISLLEASAGTGKTWMITNLYIRYILEYNLSVRQILVVTFTNDAANELKERIRVRLLELSKIYEEHGFEWTSSSANEINTDNNISTIQYDEQLFRLYNKFNTKNHYAIIKLAMHNIDEASIHTIHGFLKKVLTTYAFESSVSINQELITDEQELLLEAITSIYRDDIYNNLDDTLKQILVEENINPLELLRLFQPMLSKLSIKIHQDLMPVDVTNSDTYKNFENVWKQAQAGFNNEADAFFSYLQNNDILSKVSYKESFLSNAQEHISNILNAAPNLFIDISYIQKFSVSELQKSVKKNKTMSDVSFIYAFDDLYASLSSLQEAIKKQYKYYLAKLCLRLQNKLENLKNTNNTMGFNDLLTQIYKIMQTDIGNVLSRKLKANYPVIMIDEFQDTDIIQYQIVTHIYNAAIENSHFRSLVFFVGDPKQAIYSFRGANLYVYLQAKRASHKVYNLNTNYRSSQNLLKAINDFYAAHQNPFIIKEIEYLQLESGVQQVTDLYVNNKQYKPFTLYQFNKNDKRQTTNEYIAELVANQIAYLLTQNSLLVNSSLKQEEKVHAKDITVLVETHAQADIVSKALKKYKIDSIRHMKQSVFQSLEANQVFEILTAIADYKNMQKLKWALSQSIINTDLQLIENEEFIMQKMANFAYYHDLWHKYNFMQAFYKMLHNEQIPARLLAEHNGARILTNILHIAEILSEQSRKLSSSDSLLKYFAKELTEPSQDSENNIMRLESDDNLVKIMTIHASKGLEFNIVFLPFLWNTRKFKGNLTTYGSASDVYIVDKDINAEYFNEAVNEYFLERLRLQYVALTRAKYNIFVYLPVINDRTKEGKLKTSEMYASSLGFSIFGTGAEDVSGLKNILNASDGDKHMQQALQAWQENYELIDVLQAQLHANNIQQAEPQIHTELYVFESPNYRNTWQITSFSRLAFAADSDADHDHIQVIVEDEELHGFYSFPKGVKAGSCMHLLFEQWATKQGELKQNIQNALKLFNISSDFYELVYKHIQVCLTTNLQGFCLQDIDLNKSIAELEFTFSIKSFNQQTLINTLLRHNKHKMAQAAKYLNFETLSGFLKGFIDLVFEYHGLYFIIDYKTNYLGHNEQMYTQEDLEQSILKEHYYLQYLIYLVALRRYLKFRLAENYSDDLIGGVYYLFIRAMPKAGVYFDRLSNELLAELDVYF